MHRHPGQIFPSQRRHMLRRAFAPIACAAIIACTASPPPAGDARGTVTDNQQATNPVTANQALLALADDHARRILRASPEWASQLGVDESIGGEGFSERLSDYGPDSNSALRALLAQLQAELVAIDRNQLTGVAADTWDVLEATYALSKRQNAIGVGEASLLGIATPYAVNPLFSPQINLPRLFASELRVRNSDELDAFLTRLKELSTAIISVANQVEHDAANGLTPPRFILDAVAESARRFGSENGRNHPICQSLARQLAGFQNPVDNPEAAITRCSQQLEDSVFPAFGQFAERMDTLGQSASDQAGIWQSEHGEELYQIALEYYGAGAHDAESIHRLGLDETNRIHAEMDEILRSLGLTEGSVVVRMEQLRADPTYQIADTDEAREALLDELSDFVETALDASQEWFDGMPRQPIEVRRIPVYEQDSAAGAYYTKPSMDGSRPGVFWINLKDTADWRRFSLKTLVVHEAVPGHHFQASVELAESELPLIRNMMFFSDSGEGWALYAEALAVEMGLYHDDPASNLGRLAAELYRAARLVVDTGLHHKRWSRAQAIEWMVGVTGETEASITREVDRYASWPGQATSYKLGMLRIQAMRQRAEEQLGLRFNLPAFHSEILRAGSMPIGVLDRRIDRWIESQLSPAIASNTPLEL